MLLGAAPEPRTLVAIVVAVAASGCFGVGTILQALGTRHVSSEAGISWRRLPSLLRRRAFRAGLLLDLLGFACASFAVRSLPLFLVQAITCSSVGVTAALAARLLRERLRRIERLALAGTVVGLSSLVAAAAPSPAHVGSFTAELLITAGFPASVALVWAVDRRRRLGPAVLGALSGAAFGVAALAARVLDMPAERLMALAEPLVWGAVAFTVLGLLLLIVGLDRGSATAVSAASMSVEALLPAGIAVLFLGDGARPGWAPVALSGFALSTVCAVVLSVHRDRPVAAAPAPVAVGGSRVDHFRA